MNWLKWLGLGALTATGLIAVTSAANANSYAFSYPFSDVSNCCAPASPYSGYRLVGSFSGTPNGANDVINISNVSAQLLDTTNSFVMSLGTLSVWSYLGPANTSSPSTWTLGGAVASFDGLDNNFLFANSSTYGAWTNYFYVIQPWINPGPGNTSIAISFSGSGLAIDGYNGQYFPSNWTLTETPLPSTWTMLLAGLGIAAYLRKKKASTAAA